MKTSRMQQLQELFNAVEPISDKHKEWIVHNLESNMGSKIVVSRGNVHHAHTLPGFVINIDGENVGLITYHIQNKQCEIVTLNSTRQGIGVGTVLIETVKNLAREKECDRLWLITTNDNIDAIRFYQTRGFEMVAVHRRAIEESRKLKPSIAKIGYYGIPIRDEIECECNLEIHPYESRYTP